VTAIDLTGQKFGAHIVVGRAGKSRWGKSRWHVRCECGREKIALGYKLIAGIGIKCRQRSTALAGVKAIDLPEYQSWYAMIVRCRYPRGKDWHRYGGRGISVCDAWRKSFWQFLSDVGPRPTPSHSIDRYPDNDGNYEPGNCRWATRKQQMENRSNSAAA
jgi:hypothetical protein